MAVYQDIRWKAAVHLAVPGSEAGIRCNLFGFIRRERMQDSVLGFADLSVAWLASDCVGL
jgi:hypothetical protein